MFVLVFQQITKKHATALVDIISKITRKQTTGIVFKGVWDQRKFVLGSMTNSDTHVGDIPHYDFENLTLTLPRSVNEETLRRSFAKFGGQVAANYRKRNTFEIVQTDDCVNHYVNVFNHKSVCGIDVTDGVVIVGEKGTCAECLTKT